MVRGVQPCVIYTSFLPGDTGGIQAASPIYPGRVVDVGLSEHPLGHFQFTHHTVEPWRHPKVGNIGDHLLMYNSFRSCRVA